MVDLCIIASAGGEAFFASDNQVRDVAIDALIRLGETRLSFPMHWQPGSTR
ncbi:hypothetical protein [Microbacterium sp. CJ88]|uniref:hypothetical protein n=1 Tax=Microbacterium sp. CJ88 TaxID=3445672 RepID=UPI003F65E281